MGEYESRTMNKGSKHEDCQRVIDGDGDRCRERRGRYEDDTKSGSATMNAEGLKEGIGCMPMERQSSRRRRGSVGRIDWSVSP